MTTHTARDTVGTAWLPWDTGTTQAIAVRSAPIVVVAGVLVAGCGGSGGSTPEPTAPAPTAGAVTVQLTPESGPDGTEISVQVPECTEGLQAGLAPVSKILLSSQDPATGDGLVLSGSVAQGTFEDSGEGSVVVPKSTAAGTYYVGVVCPVNLGKATTSGFQLPDGRTADQGYGSAPFQVT